MAYEPQYVAAIFDEDSSKYVLARVTRPNSSWNMTAITSTDITSITRAVYSVPSSTIILTSTTLTTTNVVITTSTGTIWTKDGDGFNFVDAVPVTAFPNPNETVLIEYKFTFVDNTIFPMRVRGPVLPLEGS